jgi:phosphatidylglycerol---prolipoprotein diacylglyceryl transferase
LIDAVLNILASAPAHAIDFNSLGLGPVALDLGFFQLRWYSLAYLVGILAGWWYCLKLLSRPGAPMARRHADDMVFYGTLGVILGGRIGYVLFYRPEFYIENPLEILQLWDGGMSFHGGAAGTSIAMFYLAWKNKLNVLRVHDYVSCVVPFALFLGRLANFVNAELWGRPTDVPWAIRFPENVDGVTILGPPRHPSQLYEAGLEGLLLLAVLAFLFWRTDARYKPGLLTGVFVLGYGLSRFLVEFYRQPDQGLENLSWGLTMGQTLTLPMILAGLYLIVTAKGRRQRVEPIAGTESVA